MSRVDKEHHAWLYLRRIAARRRRGHYCNTERVLRLFPGAMDAAILGHQVLEMRPLRRLREAPIDEAHAPRITVLGRIKPGRADVLVHPRSPVRAERIFAHPNLITCNLKHGGGERRRRWRWRWLDRGRIEQRTPSLGSYNSIDFERFTGCIRRSRLEQTHRLLSVRAKVTVDRARVDTENAQTPLHDFHIWVVLATGAEIVTWECGNAPLLRRLVRRRGGPLMLHRNG